MTFSSFKSLSLALFITTLVHQNEAGLIKDIYQKITHINNKTQDSVRESASICGNGVFATPDERSLSPEIIFITNKPSKSEEVSFAGENGRDSSSGTWKKSEGVLERTDEFRFHIENITLRELERQGFNRNAPVTFLLHGFTSGYPLQTWISAIVETYTINEHLQRPFLNDGLHSERGNSRINRHRAKSSELGHNLFIVNWNYAARGILYPRAVANIPIVAAYVARFINEKLLDEAEMDPSRVQLIGHSLGAHLAGFIGKNTRSKLGRIYGLDPAGPCFGTISGPLYPSSKRLAPSDASEVITIHTNSALLGIDKPLGKYSIFVEGGASQPGCKGGGVFKSISTLTLDGENFDSLSCSHSRAPNLLTYRHGQSGSEDECQLVAYGCEDWEQFIAGRCGECRSHSHGTDERFEMAGTLKRVDCVRIGLNWQYDGVQESLGNLHYRRPKQQEREWNSSVLSSAPNYHREPDDRYASTRRPSADSDSGRRSIRPSSFSDGIPYRRDKREVRNTTYRETTDKSEEDSKTEGNMMFLKTGDTQPYCVYQYQVILELNEPFPNKKPPISLLLQDSQPDISDARQPARGHEKNSLSNDDFGYKFNDKIYTHLMVSARRLGKVDHGTLLFRNGLAEGHKILKSLTVNYMSNIDPGVRRKLSSQLCLVRTISDRNSELSEGNRFYFEPCKS